ncbi:MAG: type I methionyl aminopeptidase [Clostridia bacterium]
MIHIKNEKEIQLMREAGEIVKKIFTAMEKEVKPGVTTLELDTMVAKIIKENKAKPSFIGVPCMFPEGKSYKHCTCMSVNDAIIHGIPNNTPLKEGDVLCLDVTIEKNGYCADAGRTYAVGKVSKTAEKLIKVAEEAFFYAMDYAKAGNRIGDISNAIQTYVEKNGFGLLRDFQGHGIGKEMHEDPGVPNIGRKGTGMRLVKGMGLAIEPMITEGNPDVEVLSDLWTIVTKDGKLGAYYENTIIITENSPDILTF